MDTFGSFRLRRFQGTDGKNVSESRQAKMATEAGTNSVGDYGQRRTVRTTEG